MGIEVTWLGHATVAVDLDGVRLVSDPLVRRHNGILRRAGAQPSRTAWAGADAVLLSHLHHDHAEVASLRHFAGLPVLTAPGNAVWARRKGLDARGLEQGEWFPVGSTGEVEVCLVRADHGSRPMPHRPNHVNGHLVRGPSGVVWLAGDTEVHDEMEHFADHAGAPVDLALVPVGGWGPRLSPGHMDPQEAAVACRLTRTRFAVPVHFKTLHLPFADRVPRGWMERPGPQFLEAAAREAPGCQALELVPGESFRVPSTL